MLPLTNQTLLSKLDDDYNGVSVCHYVLGKASRNRMLVQKGHTTNALSKRSTFISESVLKSRQRDSRQVNLPSAVTADDTSHENTECKSINKIPLVASSVSPPRFIHIG